MTIEMIARLVVGYRFSDLCVVNKKMGTVSFVTPGLQEKIKKKFENEVIDIEEITPEFISLIFDLDLVEFPNQNDGIIGKKLEQISVGEKDTDVRNFHEIEMAQAEIKSKIENIDPSILSSVSSKISMVGEVKVGSRTV